MSKFTIEYTRTVRVRQYETLKIGIIQEFRSEENDEEVAYQGVKNQVNYWIDKELERLQEEIKHEPKSR